MTGATSDVHTSEFMFSLFSPINLRKATSRKMLLTENVDKSVIKIVVISDKSRI